jgi:hypothetical protein
MDKETKTIVALKKIILHNEKADGTTCLPHPNIPCKKNPASTFQPVRKGPVKNSSASKKKETTSVSPQNVSREKSISVRQ